MILVLWLAGLATGLDVKKFHVFSTLFQQVRKIIHSSCDIITYYNNIPTFIEVPQPPGNCILSEQTGSLDLTCTPGFDGGLHQHFLLEVISAANTEGMSASSSSSLSTVTTRRHPADADNEISTMNDQVNFLNIINGIFLNVSQNFKYKIKKTVINVE